ncbi:MAG: FGGY-family carbohydrate kinase [Propionibacteriaceae bacterium]|nr:FGGY-family carbohydrate kinase [Propionibacteriaceae bacterium]
MTELFLGVDVGTSSTKGVLVDGVGRVLAQTTREHKVDNPAPGRFEMDGAIWWDEFVSIARELVGTVGADATVAAVGVSGMGPCVQLTDANNKPTTPSALYGVDMRATAEIEELNDELGAEAIFERTDSYLTTQAAGPKLRWFARHAPDAYARASRFHMPASLLVAHLTGEYVLDRQSASQCTPLYDAATQEWHTAWAEAVAPGIDLPRLAWAGDEAGRITAAAASATGLPEGIPVAVGTVDAWAEGLSVGATKPGDLMLMYGTTMFLVGNTTGRVRHPNMWGTTGLEPGQYNLAGGMATSGAITTWLRDLTGADYATLSAEAAPSTPGANGLLMLPYFAGERTPIQDPDARGTIIGLTLAHTRGDLYRAALEATAFGVRHNVEAYADAGVPIERVVAVGGGTTGSLWPQIVTDVIGRPQVLREKSVGASFGDAFLAARLLDDSLDIDTWNPAAQTLEPQPGPYDELYQHYRALHEATRATQHALAARQRG